MPATGASRSATGSITANVDSTLTLANPSACVLIDNHSGVTFNLRLNAAVSPTTFDFQLADGERAWITDIRVDTVHVYGNATTGLTAVYW
jgi:hypothetical protein